MSKVGVILSGCGVFDGSEIHEATLTLLYLDQAGAEAQCFAPDKDQMHVIDHCAGKPTEESRNVLAESARIARGNIRPLSEINLDGLDAVIFPGGFGAAKNLCDFAVKGHECSVDAEVTAVIKEAHDKGKIIGCICIAPALIAAALKDSGAVPKLTIGTDANTMQALKAMNADPVEASVFEICVDEKNRIVSTPAYMLGKSIKEIATGIEKLVNKVVCMC